MNASGEQPDGGLPVVLVHLGRRTPRFLATCVGQARAVGGVTPLVVGPRAAARYRGPRLDRFRACEQLSGFGLRRFWRYACERFFVLEEHMRRAGLERCLHIESDVLLYRSPGDLEIWLKERYGNAVTVCPLTEHEDTAAVMYVGSRASLASLNESLLELVALGPDALLDAYGGPMANEMRMLKILRLRGLAAALPTTIAEGAALGAPCLFDPASYGQWVGGTHSEPGVPYAGDHHAIGRELLAGRYEVGWGGRRRVPFVRELSGADAPRWQLANLHIHSKRLEDWAWDDVPARQRGFRRHFIGS